MNLANRTFSVCVPTTIAAGIVDWLAQLNDFGRLLITCLGVASGLLAVIVGSLVLKRRRYEALEARLRLCRTCLETQEAGSGCLVPVAARPGNCPMGEFKK